MKYFVVLFLMSSCGIQSIPKEKNSVEAAMAEVLNQYKRRSDLIPNLVKVVKGYASHEQETLEAVVLVRSKASQISIDSSKLPAEVIENFQSSQGNLSLALVKLMVVVEKYPQWNVSENKLKDIEKAPKVDL